MREHLNIFTLLKSSNKGLYLGHTKNSQNATEKMNNAIRKQAKDPAEEDGPKTASEKISM